MPIYVLELRLYPPQFVGKIYEKRHEFIQSKPDIPEDCSPVL